MTKLIEAIVKSAAFKDYLTILEDEATEENIRTEKVFQRRERFTNKILIQTGTLGISLDEAKKMVEDILIIVDTTTLKHCKWIGSL